MENLFNQILIWQIIAIVLFILLTLFVLLVYFGLKPLMNRSFLYGVSTAHKKAMQIPRFTRANVHFEITKLIDEKANNIDQEFNEEIRDRINLNFQLSI